MTPFESTLRSLQLKVEDLRSQLCDRKTEARGWDESLMGNLLIEISDVESDIRAMTGEGYGWKVPSMAACRKVVGPPSGWAGNCHAVASQLVGTLGIPGRIQRGHWVGPIVRGSIFYPRPFTQHSWVLLQDGRVFDPTRWAFDSPLTPYLWLGPSGGDEYDLGGNGLRHVIEQTTGLHKPPLPDGAIHTLLFDEGKVAYFVRELFRGVLPRPRAKGPRAVRLAFSQLMYLANRPLSELGSCAGPIYRALTSQNLGGLIPIDNRDEINFRENPKKL